MRPYADSDLAAADAAPLPPELLEVERPSIATVQAIRSAAAAYAAHQAQPTADCEPLFAWNRALEKLTPAALIDLCDVWLLVEAENDIDRGEM